MIQDLVLMVGAYIVVRMLQVMIKRESPAYAVVQVVAGIVMVGALLITAITLTRSADLANLLK